MSASTTDRAERIGPRMTASAAASSRAWARRRDPDLPAHLSRDALRRRMLATADGLAVLGGVGVAQLQGSSSGDAFWAVALLPVWLLLAKLHGLYDRDHRTLRHLTVDELGTILTWGTVSAAVVLPLLALTPAGAPGTAAAVGLWLATVVLAGALRGIARVLWRAITPPSTAVLVGTGPLERATRRKLELFSDIHVQVCGQLDALQTQVGEQELEERARAACGGRLPERMVVCEQDVHETLLADLIRMCRRRRIKLSVVPPLRGMFGTAVRLTHVAELPLVEYHTWDASTSTLALKRAFDVVVATLALVLLTPLLLAVAIAVRIDSRGPVFYTQRRAGLRGRPFRMVKFRTMVCDAEQRLAATVDFDELETPMFKLEADPRTTRLGRILRRWSIDELPQLVNVLRGEMSLVGPRPEQLQLVERYLPEHRFRLDAMPGMTGPMQVYGRGALTFEERLAIEREYVENLSLGRDLRLLLLTLPAVLSGRGAY